MDLPKDAFNGAKHQISEKQARLLSALFFISGIVLIGLFSIVDFLESERKAEYIMVVLRALALIAGVGFVSYRTRLVSFVEQKVTLIEKGIAFLCAAAAAVGVSLRFFGAVFSTAEAGAFTLAVVNVMISRALTIAVLVLAGLIAAYALFFIFAATIRILREALRREEQPELKALPAQTKPIYDWLVGIAIALAAAAVCAFTIDSGHNWGPDFASYIKQGIAIAKGNFGAMNCAWGYSAMLAVVYNFVGYDITTFSSLIYYKIPAIICLSFAAVTLLFYFRRRFSLKWAAVLTLIFALNPYVVGLTNNVISNVPHLLFSMLSILCLYRLFESKTRASQIVYGVLSGLFIWYSDAIRSNGIVLLLTLLCVHAVSIFAQLLKKKRAVTEFGEQARVNFWPAHLLPYGVFLLLWLVVSRILPDTGTETSLLGEATVGSFLSNIEYYVSTLTTFVWSITRASLPEYLLPWLWIPLLAIGFWKSLKKDLLSCVYFGGTMLLLLLLVFRQGLRYPLPVLPMLVFFIAVGIQAIVQGSKKLFGSVRYGKLISILVVAFLIFNLAWATTVNTTSNLKNDRVFNAMSYSEDAKDVYRYIQDHTEENATISFNKPPVIAINTNRTSVSDISLAEPGSPLYLLITEDEYAEHQVTDEFASLADLEASYGVTLTLVYENPLFQLYVVNG